MPRENPAARAPGRTRPARPSSTRRESSPSLLCACSDNATSTSPQCEPCSSQPSVVSKEAARAPSLGAVDLVRALGDHVDHAGQRVGAVDRRARSADHLDACDVAHRDAAASAAIAEVQLRDRHAVHQHQHLRVLVGVDAAYRVDRGEVGRGQRDVHARHGRQHFLQRVRAQRPDVLGGDHRGHGRCLGDELLLAGRDAEELLLAEGEQQVLLGFRRQGGAGLADREGERGD